MREYDPRSGFIGISYAYYASPISESLMKRLIIRHRLEKRDPAAALSDPMRPIVYYLDPGVPEPVRSALLSKAHAGGRRYSELRDFRNAFRVETLPADADPMDIRYNLIDWIHRSTSNT